MMTVTGPPNGSRRVVALLLRWGIPLLAFLGGYLVQSGWGYNAPASRLRAIEDQLQAHANQLERDSVRLSTAVAERITVIYELRRDIRFLSDLACANILETRPRAETRESIRRCYEISGTILTPAR